MSRLPIHDTSTVAEVGRMLREALEAERLIDEYFSGAPDSQQRYLDLVRRYRWIACYAVTGGSEGHYVHVDLVTGYGADDAGQVLHLFLGKTFLGLEHAQKIAGRCAQLLGA